jgi:hypothetical protein
MNAENSEPAGLCCSFCERSADEVHQLAISPVDETIAICDRCVWAFSRQLPQPEPEAAEGPEPV